MTRETKFGVLFLLALIAVFGVAAWQQYQKLHPANVAVTSPGDQPANDENGSAAPLQDANEWGNPQIAMAGGTNDAPPAENSEFSPTQQPASVENEFGNLASRVTPSAGNAPAMPGGAGPAQDPFNSAERSDPFATTTNPPQMSAATSPTGRSQQLPDPQDDPFAQPAESVPQGNMPAPSGARTALTSDDSTSFPSPPAASSQSLSADPLAVPSEQPARMAEPPLRSVEVSTEDPFAAPAQPESKPVMTEPKVEAPVSIGDQPAEPKSARIEFGFEDDAPKFKPAEPSSRPTTSPLETPEIEIGGPSRTAAAPNSSVMLPPATTSPAEPPRPAMTAETSADRAPLPASDDPFAAQPVERSAAQPAPVLERNEFEAPTSRVSSTPSFDPPKSLPEAQPEMTRSVEVPRSESLNSVSASPQNPATTSSPDGDPFEVVRPKQAPVISGNGEISENGAPPLVESRPAEPWATGATEPPRSAMASGANVPPMNSNTNSSTAMNPGNPPVNIPTVNIPSQPAFDPRYGGYRPVMLDGSAMAAQPPVQPLQPVMDSPASVPTSVSYHRIAPEESFWSIARKYYGAGRYSSALAAHNADLIADPRRMRPGLEIRIPDVAVLERNHGELIPSAGPPVRNSNGSNMAGSASQPAVRTASSPGSGAAFDFDPEPAARPTRPAGSTYIVAPGESFWRISQRVYGTGRYFEALAEFNRDIVPDPTEMRAGIEIRTPEANVLEAKFPKLLPRTDQNGAALAAGPIQTVSATEFAPRGEVRAEAKPNGYFVGRDGAAYYRVMEADTLSGIAQDHLGKSTRWMQILDLNRDIISDETMLRAGMVLRLPSNARPAVIRNP